MQFKKNPPSYRQFILSTVLLFPFSTFAHYLEITATMPFPATVAASTYSFATFTVTNVSTIPITAVDQSNFPDDSGLSVFTSTCGNELNSGEACIIQLALDATTVGKKVSTALKIWAAPSMDAVQHPIQFTVTGGVPGITIAPININSNLPKLREPLVAEHEGKWLIVSGSFGEFHDFNNNFNTDIYVYDPVTLELWSVPIANTTLPVEVKNQLASSVPQFLQDGNTLYIIGGFYSSSPTSFTTLNTVTAIDVPGMINAIILGNQDITSFVKTKTEPQLPEFKVTGGQLGKIGQYFYLAYGHDCEGRYCREGQIYTNTIYKFTMNPSLDSIEIVKKTTATASDSSWRRRDYFLAPFIAENTESLLAFAGPFQPGNPPRVWTNAIIFNENVEYNNNFITNQQANQYLAPNLSMHSARNKMTYVASFAGLSNLYWTINGLAYDESTPYGNVLDLISADATGEIREYVNLTPMCSKQPLANCLYMGLGTEIIPAGNYYDHRSILQLDQLPSDTPTLIGYLYGGLTSLTQDIFPPSENNKTTVTNQVYAVYVVPEASSHVAWQNVTNAYP